MNRRTFIINQTRAGLALAGAAGLAGPFKALAAGVPDLSVVKGDPGPAARAAVELLGGMSRFVKKGQRVVIKPNMSFARSVEAGANTHPAVVRELAAMCREAGAGRVLVLDNPLAAAEACLERSGIAEACRDLDKNMVHQVNNPRLFTSAEIPGATSLTRTQVMKEVLKADVLIAAPAAKSHSSAGVSLSMKGMMGLVLNRGDFHWKHDLDDAIVDLASLLKPALIVIDGSRVLSTGGPGGPGKILGAKTVIASTDMVAADAAAVESFEWYGRRFKASQVRHIKLAAQRGLGRMDLTGLKVKNVTL
jgi:uncharacterized protein (DUF362 family)